VTDLPCDPDRRSLGEWQRRARDAGLGFAHLVRAARLQLDIGIEEWRDRASRKEQEINREPCAFTCARGEPPDSPVNHADF
jgi:hypothetical protein